VSALIETQAKEFRIKWGRLVQLADAGDDDAFCLCETQISAAVHGIMCQLGLEDYDSVRAEFDSHIHGE